MNAQAGESELMDADGCALVSKTLRDQVERFVIRFECGDFEPLAEIVVNPPAETENIDREIKVDAHLASLGVKLSKADALSRYGRTEAEDDADALRPAQPAPMAGFGGFADGRPPQPPLQSLASPLQNARRGGGGISVPPEAADAPGAILRGFAADLGPAAEKINLLLERMEAGEDVREDAARLAEELPSLMPDDPAMAAVIEEAMAGEFARAAQEESSRVENGECRAKDSAHCPVHGTPAGPRNDGKIDFRGNSRAKAKADGQAARLGYANVDDLMKQSADVPKERIDKILKGGVTCAPHEAVAVLRSGATIKPGIEGEEPVKLTESALRHYVCGERRAEPEIERLKTLPIAILAIRKPDSVRHELDNMPVIPGKDGRFPKKTQTTYGRFVGKKDKMNVYAYTDSGVLSGWHIKN